MQKSLQKNKDVYKRQFLNSRKDGQFDFAREGWLMDYNAPINMLEMFTTKSGNNDMQFGR